MRPGAIIKTFLAVVFVCAVPLAMWYNLGYDRYGTIDRPTDSVFIQICTVHFGRYNNSWRQKAAEYCNKNKYVKIFILSFENEEALSSQVNPDIYDIKIIYEDGTFYAFISSLQTPNEISHCESFLVKVRTETEYNLVWKKS